MELDAKLLQDLSQTSYACSTLETVTGGLTNFTFRGRLVHPLPDGSQTVIIKHGEEYGSGFADFRVPTSRCVIEQEMLRRVRDRQFPPVVHQQVSVRPPRLYHFDLQTNTQIMEDIAGSERLRDVARDLSSSKAVDVDSKLLGMLQSNAMIDDVLHRGLGEKILAHGGSVDVRDTAEKQLKTVDGEGRGVMYGDLTTKKCASCVSVLLHVQIQGGNDVIKITPIDWEACRLGFHMQDLALLVSDLFVQHSLESCPAALAMIRGLVKGYGPVSDAVVFQAAVYSGIYLFLWEGGGPYAYKGEQVGGLLDIALSLVVHGATKDREAIKETFLWGLLA
ncbi:hypothetical protein AK830_g105 [Neonectria ditissima]|uniref:Aminoglycoside phosphotransferase domain-containing protein n=1 Tax=Neonectria ditissima TaxID=78410 RepID=A0A0P7BY58_9HYPO|nr:hypothetical protein AK830_g105 [Neonectria ditissima]